ncbi:MAG: TldD/PmbA family protein [Methanomassiliicoccales archaeon]|jgi:TldD protein|nr:TldD/PmbA family protein [Methanomassiliicoccales archaeon]
MEDILSEAVDRMLREGAEFCDTRFQTIHSCQIRIVDGGIRALNEERIGGLCFRARIGGSWGYASTVALDRSSTIASCINAVKNAKLGGSAGQKIMEMPSLERKIRADLRIHPIDVPIDEKIKVVKELESSQRVDKRIVNTNANYRDEVRTNFLMNSFGAQIKWEEVRVRLIAYSVASEAGRQEIYYESVDGTGGFEIAKSSDLESIGRKCGEEAIRMLEAKKPPSGYLTCISDPQITGLLAHEVIGHAAEADEVVKRRSFLTKAVGEIVASEAVTLVDDGTIKGAYGSIPVDDEGVPSSRTLIIDRGIYRGYMHNLETASQMGARPTGNGRAQDFSKRIWARMTNTYIEGGDWTLEEMIEDIDYGVLAEKMISGMEDPVGGGFEAKTLRGYLIEKGEIRDLLRSFTLTGNALQILKTMDAVGTEVQLDGGTCGKGTEDFVPVSSGGPYCRSRLIVGGG